jgi:hypothetical protein
MKIKPVKRDCITSTAFAQIVISLAAFVPNSFYWPALMFKAPTRIFLVMFSPFDPPPSGLHTSSFVGCRYYSATTVKLGGFRIDASNSSCASKPLLWVISAMDSSIDKKIIYGGPNRVYGSYLG